MSNATRHTDSYPSHDGVADSPTSAAAASTSETVAAAASSAPLVASLYRDALHSIFAFLSVSDLALCAVHVSRSWRAAVESLPPRDESLQLPSSDRLSSLFRSPTRRLVASIELEDLQPPSRVQLRALSERMPHLTALECHLGPDSRCGGVPVHSSRSLDADDDAGPVMGPTAGWFPPSLRSLTLCTDHGEWSWEEVERLLSAVAASCPRLAGFSLSALPGSHDIPPTLLDPLRRLAPTLHTLCLDASDLQLHSTHIDAIRALPHLTDLSLQRPLSLAEMEWLTADPPPLQLRDIDWLEEVDEEEAACLAKLSGLTHLHIHSLLAPDPSFLTHLPQLQSLTLSAEDDDPTLLAHSLAQCSALTQLHFTSEGMSSDQLTTALSGMAHLTQLTLQLGGLESLAAFSTLAHLRQSLRILNLNDCWSLPPSEVEHLLCLTSLQELSLSYSFSMPLDESMQQLLSTGGDAAAAAALRAERGVLPNLREFFCYRPVEEHADASADEGD